MLKLHQLQPYHNHMDSLTASAFNRKARVFSASLWPAVLFFITLALRFWISLTVCINLPNFLTIMPNNNLLFGLKVTSYIMHLFFLLLRQPSHWRVMLHYILPNTMTVFQIAVSYLQFLFNLINIYWAFHRKASLMASNSLATMTWLIIVRNASNAVVSVQEPFFTWSAGC